MARKRAALAAALIAALAVPAAAEPTDAVACAEAFERGQIQRNAGKLMAARSDLLACAQTSCPELVRRECVLLHTEVDTAVPSIVVTAGDATGRDLADARLFVDGQLATERLDGRAIELDPGPHDLRVEIAGGEPLKKALVVPEGQKAQLVRFEFPAKQPVESVPDEVATAESNPGLALAGVGFALAGAALVAGIVTGALAWKDGEPCRNNQPECTDAYIADHQPLAHVATASFAVAGAAAVVGVVGLIVHASPTKEGTELGLRVRGSF
jgi:hypothetical protein